MWQNIFHMRNDITVKSLFLNRILAFPASVLNNLETHTIFLPRQSMNLESLVVLNNLHSSMPMYMRKKWEHKGGNNVASLLVHDLQKKGWIIEGKSSKSLTIILDNCGGQNKNKYILQLPMYLVEMGFLEKY